MLEVLLMQIPFGNGGQMIRPCALRLGILMEGFAKG